MNDDFTSSSFFPFHFFEWIVFLLIFYVYLYSLSPTISPRDSGELITAVHVIGVPHPPGYPLFVLVGKICDTIFPGNIAFRINLTSAIFSTLTGVIFYLTISLLIQDKLLRILGVFLLCFSNSFFSQAIVTEVFSLHLFFVAIFIYLCLLRMKVNLNFISLTLFLSFLFGLSLGNQHTIILCLPAFFYAYFSDIKKPHISLWAFLFFLIGISIYIALPIISARNPPIDDGNPENLQNFFRILSRYDYGTFQLHKGESTSYSSLLNGPQFLVDVVRKNYSNAGFILCITGFLFMLSKERKVGFLLILFFAIPFMILVGLSNVSSLDRNSLQFAVLERLVLMILPILCLWILFGIEQIVSLLCRVFNLKLIFFYLITSILLYPIITFMGKESLFSASQRNSYFVLDYGKDILRSIPKHSLIFLATDTSTFSTLYLQSVLHKREDLKIISPPFLRTLWGRQQLEERFPSLVPPDSINLPTKDFFISLVAYNKKQYRIFYQEPFSIYRKPNLRLDMLVNELRDDQNPYELLNNKRFIETSVFYRSLGLVSLSTFIEELCEKYFVLHWNYGLMLYNAGQIEDALKQFMAAMTLKSEKKDIGIQNKKFLNELILSTKLKRTS